MNAVVVGAGLCGLAMAAKLAREGFSVQLHEGRSARALEEFDSKAGRQISVDLSARGIRPLAALGVWPALRSHCRQIRRRVFHPTDGPAWSLPFGGVVYVCDRARLRQSLLRAAESAGATFHFESRLVEVAHTVRFSDSTVYDAAQTVVIGCDGAHSQVRAAIERDTGARFSRVPSEFVFKPIQIAQPLAADAMHMWPGPRGVVVSQPLGNRMVGALVLRPDAMAETETEAGARAVLNEFPTLESEGLAAQLVDRPAVSMHLVRGTRWRAQSAPMIVIGDAAHAMPPFLGQGLNASLEDCRLLGDALARHADPWVALARFEASRVADANAAVELSATNYPELCDPAQARRLRRTEARLVGDPSFATDHQIACFSHLPYRVALARRARQRRWAWGMCS